MINFLSDFAITAAFFFPLFFFTFAVLWRLRQKGFYTILLGLFFEVVFLRLGFAIAPGVFRHHGPGMPPAELGIATGCGMPMLYMAIYYQAQRQKKAIDQT